MRSSMPVLCIILAITTSAVAYDKIVGYEPETDVREHSFIDLDQQEMETHLATPDFTKAKAIYTTGGNSGGYAEFTVPVLAASLPGGAIVTQAGNDGARGYVKSSAAAGATTVKVTYTSTCKQGGSSSPDISGCFTASGSLSASGVNIGQPSGLTNKYRTLAGFSSAAQSKMAGQEFYTVYRSYNQYPDYADRFVKDALDGTGNFAGRANIFRVECAKKGSAYQNVWMYVIREMEDAIMDCQSGCLTCNDDPVHAWDEAVAFYAGSLEGANGDSSGKLLYRLAEKRCADFGTCTTGSDSKATVNAALLEQFRLGQDALYRGKCVEAITKKRRIVELMSVPLVQGALRYAYKIDKQLFKDAGGAKEIAEGVAFSAAILPRIAVCDTQAAKLIKDNLGIDASPGVMKDGYVSVKQAFESTYSCMGIMCEDVGGILDAATNGYYPTAEPCRTSAGASYPMLVRYQPETDVRQHSFIDLDQQEMETHLAVADFTKAKAIYTSGGNSGGYAEFTVPALAASLAKGAAVTQAGNAGATGYVKSSAAAGATTVKVTYTSTCKQGGSSSPVSGGCFTTSGAMSVSGVDIGQPSWLTSKYRTLAGFSTAAQSKMAGQEFYTVYRAYNQYYDYADRFVKGALEGTGEFAGKEDIFRVECAKKGSAYQNVWMYVIREMEDAIADCQIGCFKCNDDPVHAWDEAVAFYAGSLEGSHGDSSGKLLYRLAEKRCTNFGTCTTGSDSKAKVNAAILDQFKLGQNALDQGRCTDAIPKKKRIVELMSVPMVQGVLRYAHKIDNHIFKAAGGSKEIAEGVAFSAAVLPRISACDAQGAKLISDNMGMNAAPPMKDGFAKVKQAFESTYSCMGITCEDVGGVLDASTNEYYAMAEPCISEGLAAITVTTEEEVDAVPVWLVIVLILLVVIVMCLCVLAIAFARSSRKYRDLAKDVAEGNAKGTPLGKFELEQAQAV